MRELPPCTLELQAHLVLLEGPDLWYDRIHKLNNLAAKAIDMWYIFGDRHILYTVYPAKVDLEMPGDVSYAVRVAKVPIEAGTPVDELPKILELALAENINAFKYLGEECHPHLTCISVPLVTMNSKTAADWQLNKMPITGFKISGENEITLLQDEDAAMAELEAVTDDIFQLGFGIESMPYVV